MDNDLETAEAYVVSNHLFSVNDDNSELEIHRYNKRFYIIIRPGNLEQSPAIKNEYLRYLNAQRADADGDVQSECSVDPEDIYDWAVKPCLSLFKELSPEPKQQTAKISLYDYYHAETFYYHLHAANDKLTPVTNPKGESFLPPAVELAPDVFHPALSFPRQSRDPRQSEWERSQMLFKPYSNGDTNGATREVASYRKTTESNLTPDVRICRLDGVVKDEWDRLMGLLLNYIDCDHVTLACAPDEETPDSLKQKWVNQIKETLAQLHDEGLVWGDAKPENVLITEGDGSVGDKEKAGTVEGDLQGPENIIKYVFEGKEAPYAVAMSGKRSRAIYEADLQAQQSPFVAYGTPLPPLDPDVRDDGSYVPVWKQEVRDERGLKRLHGAFTGGFSAGYFNTVGSKEGWTPSTFVSSRTNRTKEGPKIPEQRPEDFMDEEDIADASEAQRVQMAEGFSGLGSTQDDSTRRGAYIDVFRIEGETIGVKLLRRMGWKEGQGIGPKVRRKARLDALERPGDEKEPTHLFAPENTRMISFVKKSDHKGLGLEGQAKLSPINGLGSETVKSDDDEEEGHLDLVGPKKGKKKKAVRGGIGIGILNDTGSDDEDPYEIGPRISYNRVIGGEKKKKKPANGSVNPLLKSKPVFISRKKASSGLRKCHDGRLPLDGFILSSSDEFSSLIQASTRYAAPEIPKDWKSSKQPKSNASSAAYLSPAEAAKASSLDPKSRAAILGEAALPGKSVFDFLSPAARDRLASASGKGNLPPALGEIPKGYNLSEEDRRKELLSQIPQVDPSTALAALTRGASGFMPYAEDEAKRTRYRTYLENQAGTSPVPPSPAPAMSREDWLKELREFANCAQIFKPMSGMMATRFTSSTKTTMSGTVGSDAGGSLLSKPEPKIEDPAEQAAKVGMYGPLTRSSKDWFPSRLLCKRFNVKPPAHVQPGATEHDESAAPTNAAPDLVSKEAISEMMAGVNWNGGMAGGASVIKTESRDEDEDEVKPEVVVVDTERNEALEGERAGEAVFNAIFGDDSDDDDDD
ncbi:uncharacterized protein BP5553_01799 [Venustampulla echinocandica]|uniref:G-patch domain-containing protein n=1 Tax=Venustampulla echinocandica TaxID=2656787 RepID=A0A370U212_9HELO|nr:uncharacterized protein BP5553_01799 [Venustampulla echinocandica]RDL41820.1 hypothetical protein BP5553_01799 [Venustampulla echinocandica]